MTTPTPPEDRGIGPLGCLSIIIGTLMLLALAYGCFAVLALQ